MAIPTADDPLGMRDIAARSTTSPSWRDEHLRKIEAAIALVRKIVSNEADAPRPGMGVWADEAFQNAVCHELHRMESLQRDAAALRIIKSVFGGRA